MNNGRRLAFDYGSARIGVATTDSSGILSSPQEPIINGENLEIDLKSIITDTNPIYIAIGIPKHLSGKMGSASSEVSNFIALIKSRFNFPLYGIDERFTTISAASKLRESGRSAKESKHLIDSASAVIILESALELEKAGGLDKCEI